MLEDILSTLNFKNEEIKTYLQLLKTGPVTAGNLAKKMGVPRPSLYGFLKRLQNKGVVTQSIKWGVKIFTAEPPERINLIFRQHIENLQEKQQLYQKILPELKKQTLFGFTTPKFFLYEGKEGIKHVLKDMWLYSGIETQSLWPIKTMLDILSPDFFWNLNKERIKNDISIRAIWPADQVVKTKAHPYLGVGKEFKREIRIAPKQMSFSTGYWLYANKVAFISSYEESFGFVIESKELVDMLLSQFEMIWNISKPLKVDPKDTEPFLKKL